MLTLSDVVRQISAAPELPNRIAVDPESWRSIRDELIVNMKEIYRFSDYMPLSAPMDVRNFIVMGVPIVMET